MRSSRHLLNAGNLYVSALWLALYAQWMTIVPTIVPDQISGLIGPDNPAKEGISGTVVAAGAVVALVVAPIAGALSDRTKSRSGRRRPYLVVGMIGSCIALLLLAPFANGGRSVSVTAACW